MKTTWEIWADDDVLPLSWDPELKIDFDCCDIIVRASRCLMGTFFARIGVLGFSWRWFMVVFWHP